MLLMVVGILGLFYFTSDTFNLTCVVAVKDGKKYCVRDSSLLKESVELLAEVNQRMQKMVAFLDKKYPDDPRVRRLVKNFNPDRVVETLPTSEYTAYSEGKGSKLAFCLRKHKHEMQLIDINTLTFVALHELAHLMTSSIGHKKEFWDNFTFMLEYATEAGLYRAVDYAKHPSEYCGLTIDSNPLY